MARPTIGKSTIAFAEKVFNELVEKWQAKNPGKEIPDEVITRFQKQADDRALDNILVVREAEEKAAKAAGQKLPYHSFAFDPAGSRRSIRDVVRIGPELPPIGKTSPGTPAEPMKSSASRLDYEQGMENLDTGPYPTEYPGLTTKVGAGIAAGAGSAAALRSATTREEAAVEAPETEDFPTEDSSEWDEGETEKAEPSAGVGPVANADMYGAILSRREQDTAADVIDMITTREPSRAGIDKAQRLWEEAVNRLESRGADTSDIDAEIAAAKEEYKQAKKTNEWKEVAQMIANGLTQFAAYRAGGSKFSVGDRVRTPDIDYSARTGTALDEFRTMSGLAERKRAARRQEALDDYELSKERLRPLREAVELESDVYKQDALNKREEDRLARMSATASKREAAARAALEARAALQDRRREDENRKQELAAIASKEKAVIQAATAKKNSLEALRTQAESMGMSPEEIEKTENPEDTVFIRERTKKANLQSALLEQIRRIRSGLVSPEKTAATPVRVQLSDGRTGEIPASQVEQFLIDNKGSKVVQ